MMQSPLPAPLPGKPLSSYDPAADEGEGLLASLGHSLARVVQGVDKEGDELPLELIVSISIEITRSHHDITRMRKKKDIVKLKRKKID